MAVARWRAARSITIAVVVAVLVGCGSSKERPRIGDTRFDAPVVEREGTGGAPREAVRLPWEVWPLNADLDGVPLRAVQLLRADEMVRFGERKLALDAYRAINPLTLAPNERAALALRIASTELALGDAQAALVTLSRHFGTQGQSSDEVGLPFSLLFGYAYGRHGDIEQSLAWLSRAQRLLTDPLARVPSRSIEQGMRVVLRSAPQAQLERVSDTWPDDVLVRRLAAEELARRVQHRIADPTPAQVQELWASASGLTDDRSIASSMAEGSVGDLALGVLLPLSGRFSPLGNAIKNGVELALDAHRDRIPLYLAVADSGETVAQATERAAELMSEKRIAALFGPLLAEHGFSIAEVAARHDVPVVNFSKSAELQRGAHVLPFGPSPESQARALAFYSQEGLGLKRLALVYPEDGNGRELAAALKREFAARQVEFVFEAGYDRKDANAFPAYAQEIEQRGVDGVLVMDNLQGATRFVGSFNPNARRSLTFLGPLSWDDATQLSRANAVMRGVMFITPFLESSERPEVQQFVSTFRARFGRAPDFLAAQGFDAATLVVEALIRQAERGGSFEQALASIGSYHGLTGQIELHPMGRMTRRYALAQYVDGAINELTPAPPAPAETPNIVVRGDQIISRGTESSSEETEFRRLFNLPPVDGQADAVVAQPR